jgi:flagellin
MIDSINTNISTNINTNISNDQNSSDIRKSLQNAREEIKNNSLGKLDRLDIPTVSDGATLNISNLSATNNQLSSNLEGQNKAISATQTADRSLNFQKDLVSSIKSQFELGNQLNNDISQNNTNQLEEAKDNINNLINTFGQVSDGTIVADKSLLKPTTPDGTVYIETSDQQYSIDQKNGAKALNGINQVQQNINFDDRSVEQNLNTLDMIDGQLSQLQGKYKNVHNNLINDAQQTLSQENQNNFEKGELKNVNFGRESSDFSKLNLTAIQGSLIGSQANATLENNMRLLV